jgi:hypothetical protein
MNRVAHMPIHELKFWIMRPPSRGLNHASLKVPSGTSSFKAPRLVMPEQRKNKNDRKWNSEQPKQCTSTETHVSLHVL